MPDYKKCVIYTIRTGEGLYVGSTCNYNNRKHNHKSNINNQNKKTYNLKLYKTIRENDGAWDMQPHSEYPCNSKIEMNIEEERVRQELKADLNSYSCYGVDDKNKKDFQKEYYNINKDKIVEYQKDYRQTNKDKKRETDKAYRLANKDKIKQNKREYYLKNKII